MPEPPLNLQPTNPPGPSRIDWSIRTMTDDLAKLKKGEMPHAKIFPSRPWDELRSQRVDPVSAPPTIPEKETAPTPKNLLAPVTPSAPIPSPPREPIPLPQVPVKQKDQSILISDRKPGVPPPLTSSRPHLDLRRYLIPGGVGVITVIIAALVVVGFQRGERGTPLSTPAPSPVVEGEVFNATPSISPISASTPLIPSRQAPLTGDSQETVTATPESILQVLSIIALKPRPPQTLTELIFPGLTTEDLLRSLALDSISGFPAAAASSLQPSAVPLSTTATSTRATATPPELFLYFHTQEERLSTTTHATRLVALFQDATPPTEATRSLIESTLTAVKQDLWLGVSGQVQATLAFQTTSFLGVSVRYLNFSQPDVTLDYAFIPQRNLLAITTSREAMFAVLKRLLQEGK